MNQDAAEPTAVLAIVKRTPDPSLLSWAESGFSRNSDEVGPLGSPSVRNPLENEECLRRWQPSVIEIAGEPR